MSDDNDYTIQIISVVVFIVFIYIIFSKGFKPYSIEGLENNAAETTPQPPGPTGVAGNADTFAAQIKMQSTQLQDNLLISKYRKSYESIILNADDLLNSLMLETLLNINIADKKNVFDGFNKLNTFSQSKGALNQIMKFVDATP
jgi:hypothetical protein